MARTVHWKPLYYTSIAMFALSVVLVPVNLEWAVLVIIALVTLWSRVPGFANFFLNKLALNDFFTFIIAANSGWLVGGLFGFLIMWFSRLFGPGEWLPYTLRASIASFGAAAAVPLIISSAGGVNAQAMFLFAIAYAAAYYIQVLLFWREEIPIEIAVWPSAAFFDFGMNIVLIGAFGGVLSEMIRGGMGAGWPFIIFSALVLLFLLIAKNAKKIADKLIRAKERLIGRKGREKLIEDYFNLGPEKG